MGVFLCNNAKGNAVSFGVERGVGQNIRDDVLVAARAAIIVIVHEGFEFVPGTIIKNGKGTAFVGPSFWKFVTESTIITDTLEAIVCKGVKVYIIDDVGVIPIGKISASGASRPWGAKRDELRREIETPKLHTLYWLRANRLFVEIIQKEIVRPQNLFDRTFIAPKVIDANRNLLSRIIRP